MRFLIFFMYVIYDMLDLGDLVGLCSVKLTYCGLTDTMRETSEIREGRWWMHMYMW